MPGEKEELMNPPNKSLPLSDEEVVRRVYPNCWLGSLTFSSTCKVFDGPINKPQECTELGIGRSREAAWADARSRLPVGAEGEK